MEAADLVGSFELVSWGRADGVEPFGGGVVGALHYGSDGTMGAHLMKTGRAAIGFPPRELRRARSVLMKPWTIPFHLDVLKALGRYINASANYVAYSGTYEVRGGHVIHHVELSLIPDWVGTDLAREFSFDRGLLTLKTPEGDALVWREKSASFGRYET